MSVDQIEVRYQRLCYPLYHSVVNKELSQAVSEEFRLSFFSFFFFFFNFVKFLLELGKHTVLFLLTLLDLKNRTNMFKTGQLTGIAK